MPFSALSNKQQIRPVIEHHLNCFQTKISDKPPRDLYNAVKWSPKSVVVGVAVFQQDNWRSSSSPLFSDFSMRWREFSGC
jgi:hypothetical protein